SGEEDEHQGSIVLSRTEEEIVLDRLAAISSAVPLVGGAISNLLGGYSSERKFKRLVDVLDGMDQRLRDLSEHAEQYVTTEDFGDLLEETLRRATSEREREVRRVYRE